VRSAKLLLVVVTTMSVGGCVDRTPPPPNAEIPRGRGGPYRSDDPVKPMPHRDEYEEARSLPPPPFNDVPLVSQDTPEQRAFVEAYNAVGRPRMVVFVNRTLEGELLPVNTDEPLASVQRTRTSRGEVTVETRDRVNTDARYRDRYSDADARADRNVSDRYEARGTGPNEYRDRVDVYLRPGQYDEVAAKQIDYEAVETVLTDWLAAGGRTEIISPITARQRLTDEQVKDLQSGRPRVMGEIARELDADVLVQVTARPTRQTQRGLEVRLVAEAINVGRGGQSIGRAVVDVPPPLDKQRINKFTRFLARVLMDRMIGTWENMPAPVADDTDRERTRSDVDNRPARGDTAPATSPDTGPGPGSPLLEPPDAPSPSPSAESPDAPEAPAKDQ
jgi:hypothetical protein